MQKILKRSVLAFSVATISLASLAQTNSLKTVPNGWHLNIRNQMVIMASALTRRMVL